jgi:DnaJ-class molecular chaperone
MNDRRLFSQDEAKSLICPIRSKEDDTPCETVKCMAWRWTSKHRSMGGTWTCDECGGTGKVQHEADDATFEDACLKCDGEGSGMRRELLGHCVLIP